MTAWRQSIERVKPNVRELQLYQRNYAVSAHDLQVTLANPQQLQSVVHRRMSTSPARTRSFTQVSGGGMAAIRGSSQQCTHIELIIDGKLRSGRSRIGYAVNIDDHAVTDEALLRNHGHIANFARRFCFYKNYMPRFRSVCTGAGSSTR